MRASNDLERNEVQRRAGEKKKKKEVEEKRDIET
jgi:hypothetical protein